MQLVVKLLITFTIIAGYSCENRLGCDDPSAVNYDSQIIEHDGSCLFEFKGSLKWTNSLIYFIDADIMTISIYIDDKLLAEDVNVFIYDNDEPLTCYDSYWFNFQKTDFGPNPYVHLEVFNQNDVMIHSERLNLSSNDECRLIEVTFE